MILDQIREAKWSKPFRPFSIQLKDGRKVRVSQQFAIAFCPLQVVVISRDESITSFEPEMISSIAVSDKGKRRSPRKPKK